MRAHQTCKRRHQPRSEEERDELGCTCRDEADSSGSDRSSRRGTRSEEEYAHADEFTRRDGASDEVGALLDGDGKSRLDVGRGRAGGV